MDNDSKKIKDKKIKKNLLVLGVVSLVLLTNVAAYYLGSTMTFSKFSPSIENKSALKALGDSKDVSKYGELFKVRDILYKYYDGEIDEDKLVDGAIKGMTASLQDPYTVFMTEKEYSDFKEKTEGNYMGVGIRIGAKDGKLIVVEALEDSPAMKAGVQKDDVILKVNDVEVSESEIDKAMSMMKGKEKANVKLTLLRQGKGELDVNVTRDIIKEISVKGEIVSDNIGYIRILGFEKDTGKDFNQKLKELKSNGAKGIVMDLRGNPGGYMNECVDVVSNFIPEKKLIVSTIDKYENKEVNESKGGSAIDMPLVILTDKGSASASEIVAGAVRDYKVGTLIGENTFGKGVVQVVIPNKDIGSALRVTISKYYTPNGENIHKKGIKPDIEVEYPKELLGKAYVRENDPQFSKAIEVIKEKMK